MGMDINKFISDKVWERFENIINTFMDNDVGKQKIIWAKKIEIPDSFGEDSYNKYLYRELEVLCNYNTFRNWPINKESISGELDQENLSILVSRNYLTEHGYINSSGYIDFNWSEDRFILHGLVYKPSGDTEIAQTNTKNLLFQIILKRDLDTIIDFVNEDLP